MRCERDARRGEASLESIFVPPLHRCGAELVCLCDAVSMAGLCRRGSRKMVMSDALGTRALAACARNCPPQFRHRQRRRSPASPGRSRADAWGIKKKGGKKRAKKDAFFFLAPPRLSPPPPPRALRFFSVFFFPVALRRCPFFLPPHERLLLHPGRGEENPHLTPPARGASRDSARRSERRAFGVRRRFVFLSPSSRVPSPHAAFLFSAVRSPRSVLLRDSYFANDARMFSGDLGKTKVFFVSSTTCVCMVFIRCMKACH